MILLRIHSVQQNTITIPTIFEITATKKGAQTPAGCINDTTIIITTAVAQTVNNYEYICLKGHNNDPLVTWPELNNPQTIIQGAMTPTALSRGEGSTD